MAVNTITLHGDSILHTKPLSISKEDVSVTIPGSFRKQNTKLSITNEILSKHILLVGGTGSGKTNVLNYFIEQLKDNMKKEDVMIIFDTKGDFVKNFHQQGDLVIANSKFYHGLSSRWNIYKEILVDGWGDSDIYNNTHEIIRSLFKEASEKTTQQFFPNAARDLLASLIIAQIRLGKDDTLFKQKFFNNKALKHYVDTISPKEIIKFLSIEPFSDLSGVLSYIGDGSSSQSLGVLAELQNVIRQILVGAFADEGGFSIRNFVREKNAKTLFIEYDLSIGETLKPIYRLMFDLALKEAMGRNKSEGNVYLICDEFKLLPNLQHIEDGVNFGRGLGVKVIAGIQSVEQMYQIYGENKAKNILSGFSSIIAFKANDSSTRNFISDLYGRNIVLEQYKTYNNTIVEEKREGRTVEDWDMNDLGIGEAIVGLPFGKPFKYQFDIYNRR